MGSRFPGVDPFLEGQGVWHDFHQTFIVTWREILMRRLPGNYVARVEEHVYLDRGGDDAPRSGGGRLGRVLGALCELQRGALLFPPPRRGAHRPPGGSGLDERWLILSPTSSRTGSAPISRRSARRPGRRSRSSRRPSTCRPISWVRSPRRASRWSGRTGSRIWRRSRRAGGTASPGISSAICRAAR